MARQNPDRIKGPSLTPQSPGSYPVDPYNRPSQDSSLGRLAHALGDLAPTLQRIAGNAMEGEKEDAEKKAYADFLDMEKTGKAIKSGELDPAQSAYFNRYYHEKLGMLAASRYSQDMSVAAAEALGDETDPAAFDGFAADFRQAWLKDNAGGANGDFMAGFTQGAAERDMASRNTFAQQASARLQGNAIKALYASHQMVASDILKSHVGVVNDATLQEIATALKTSNQHQYFLNPRSGTQISHTTVEAIFDLARTQQDTRLLDVLKYVDSAIPGAPLSETQDVKHRIQDVRNQINADIKKDDAFAASQAKKERQEAIDTTTDNLYEALDAAEDPSKVDVKPFQDALTGIAPEQKARLAAIRDSYIRRDESETNAQTAPLYSRAFNGTLSLEEVSDAFTVGQISKNTAKELRAQIRLTKAGKGAKYIVQDERFKRESSALAGLFDKQMGQYFSPVQSAQAWVATHQLERDWVRYRMGAGRDAGEQEAEQWLSQRSGELYLQYSGLKTSGDPKKVAQEIIGGFTAQQDGAQLSDWKKTRLVSPTFLSRIQQEYAASQAAKSNQFSKPVQSFLSGYRLKPQDVEAFIAAQSRLPERP